MACRPFSLCCSFALAVFGFLRFASMSVAWQVDFKQQIAPLLEEKCTYCHGEEEAESGLRLDIRAGMLRGGDSGLPAVVPSEPEKSYLLDVINHLDPDVQMPPDEEKLSPEELELFMRWVEDGAIWPGQMETDLESEETQLWSFQPVVRPEIPDAGQVSTGSTPHNPIDKFLIKSLAQRGLAYSEEAKPRLLLRRLSIVLTGLTPTPEDLVRFESKYARDPAKAYAEAVNTLLDSPHFGERWAQHWLDVIRWAETNGSEANLYRKNAWVYRDYVIRSFNADKPYDLFLREQIAGDTLGVGEAMGFLVAGPHVPAATVGREPAAIRQARADRMDEIMQTLGASVMGITIGCARCHNHKFDPISLRDYYAMTAVFQDIEFGSRQPEYAPEHPLRERGAELWKDIGEQREKLRDFGGWEEDWGAYRELHFPKVVTKSIRVRFKTPSVFLDEIEVLGPNGLDRNLALQSHGATVTGFPELGFENRNPISRVTDGEFGTMVWRANVGKNADTKPWLQIEFSNVEEINRIRLSNNREYYYDTDYLDRKPNLPRYECDIDVLGANGEWKPWVGTWYVNKKLKEEHPERQQILDEVQRMIGLLAEQGPRPSFVGRLVEPATTFVLLRGSPENPRDEVLPSGPVYLQGDLGLNSESPGTRRRAEFASWIASKSHPLTARVMVNRLWHHVFGSGLVSTTSDFGNAGAPPVHPELLDWLAAEFMDPSVTDSPSWSMKSLIRLMVMTAAFRQSSEPRDEGLAVDANSQLLWRYPPRRVEAEVIRDAILQASGKLDLKMGGRSYRIHNEKKTYAQWEVVDNHGPETWRRMIYQERMRRVDDQLFTAFDFPDCGQVRARRPVSTTPLQALNLLNSRFVIEQAERIAQRAELESGKDTHKSVERCFELVLGRSPTSEELAFCVEIAESGELSHVSRALINTNEFTFLP